MPDSFWTEKYMLGDWGGLRTRLEQMGVTFYGEYRNDFQGNVTGTDKNGNDRGHSVNFGRFRLNLDVNLMKLADIDGEFFFSVVWQYGGNLSGRYLNVHTLTSSIAGTKANVSISSGINRASLIPGSKSKSAKLPQSMNSGRPISSTFFLTTN
jgi:carbohydrate-selective porin OprB